MKKQHLKLLIFAAFAAVSITACEGESKKAEAEKPAVVKDASGSGEAADEKNEGGSPEAEPANSGEDAGKDETVIEEPRDTEAITGFHFEVPEGFEEMSDADIPAVEGEPEGTESLGEDYRFYLADDRSNINVISGPKDPDFSSYTEEGILDKLTKTFREALGTEAEITLNTYTTRQIGGYPSIQYDISILLEGTEVHQLVVSIDADKTYTFTFTDYSGADQWIDAFYTSMDSISFETQ